MSALVNRPDRSLIAAFRDTQLSREKKRGGKNEMNLQGESTGYWVLSTMVSSPLRYWLNLSIPIS